MWTDQKILCNHMSVQIMGASGSGKTSLLRAIAGLWRSGSGTITRYICEGSGEMHGTARHGENGSTHAIVSVLDFFSICNCQQWSHTGAESLFDMGDCNILGCFCGHICGIFWGSIFRGFCTVPRRLSSPGSIIYQSSLVCGQGCSGMCLSIANSRDCILAFSKIVCCDLRHLVQTEGIRRCLLMSTRRWMWVANCFSCLSGLTWFLALFGSSCCTLLGVKKNLIWAPCPLPSIMVFRPSVCLCCVMVAVCKLILVSSSAYVTTCYSITGGKEETILLHCSCVERELDASVFWAASSWPLFKNKQACVNNRIVHFWFFQILYPSFQELQVWIHRWQKCFPQMMASWQKFLRVCDWGIWWTVVMALTPLLNGPVCSHWESSNAWHLPVYCFQDLHLS